MLVSKLVPIVVMGGIAAHSGGAIKDRVAGAMGVADKVVTKQRLTAIADAAMLQAAAGEELSLSSPASCRAFIKKFVRLKGSAKGDPSVDQWGQPIRCQMKGSLLALDSAGPDKQFGTKDDIKASADISEF